MRLHGRKTSEATVLRCIEGKETDTEQSPLCGFDPRAFRVPSRIRQFERRRSLILCIDVIGSIVDVVRGVRGSGVCDRGVQRTALRR